MNSCQSNFEETSIKMDINIYVIALGQWYDNLMRDLTATQWSTSGIPPMTPTSATVEDLESHFQVSTMNKKWINSLKSSIFEPRPTKAQTWGVCTLNSDKSTVWPCTDDRTSTLCGFGHLRVVLHRPLHGWIFRRGQVLKGIQAHRSWHGDEVHVAVGFNFKIR